MTEVTDPNDITIDAVYFAQTHVQEPCCPYFRLVGGRNALIKVHVLSEAGADAPPVAVALKLGEESAVIELTGPSMLPKAFEKHPGKVLHRFDDCFTATIPGRWIQKGLIVTVQAGTAEKVFDELCIGPEIHLNTLMFDIHYFDIEDVEWPENWVEEIAIRRPITSMNVQRMKRLLFPEVVVKPNGGQPAILCNSPEDYERQTGKPMSGHQGTAFKWSKALQDAGGQGRLSLVYINIGNVRAGGFAEPLHGCGSLPRYGVIHHEWGHALDVEDLSPTEEPLYPYRGSMYGIDKTTTGGYHKGPAWGYDHRVGVASKHKDTPFFINPVVQEGCGDEKNIVGEWRKSPVRGGAGNEPEAPGTFEAYSDWSVRKMQTFLERRLLKWDDSESAFRAWNNWWDCHRKLFKNDGVSCPVEHEVDVYSIMVTASAVTPDANFIYPVIGPYRSGLIATFDPENPDDRRRARRLRDFGDGWDLCLRIEQGGNTRTYMMPLAWRPEDDPLDECLFQTKALNVPVRDGEVTRVELLLTPDAEVNGLPADPEVLYARDIDGGNGNMEKIHVNFGEG